MKITYLKIPLLLLLVFLAVGCQPAADYQAYKDAKKKGEKVFIKDLQKCRIQVNQSSKRSEGSEGAGERMNRERFIFKNCMKRNDWILTS